MKNNSGFAPILLVLIVVSALAVGGVVYVAADKIQKQRSEQPLLRGDNASVMTSPPGALETLISNWGYQIHYPSSVVSLQTEYPQELSQDTGSLIIHKKGDTSSPDRPIRAQYGTDFMYIGAVGTKSMGLREHLKYLRDHGGVGASDEEWTDTVVNGAEALKSNYDFQQNWNVDGKRRVSPFEVKGSMWLIKVPGGPILDVKINKNFADGMSEIYEEILSTITYHPCAKCGL